MSTNNLKLKNACTQCTKKDGRKCGLFCSKCGSYYHKLCINLHDSSYKFFIESNTFVCLPCKFLDSSSTCIPVTISQDCNSCFKTHKSKVILNCSNCKLSYHRACVSNLKHSKVEIARASWLCMQCLFPLSILDDVDFESQF